MESAPQLRAQLVHSEAGQRVVEVSAWQGERCLGSSLGEADHAETAEDRARERLLERLQLTPPQREGRTPLIRHPVAALEAHLPDQLPDQLPVQPPEQPAKPKGVAAAPAAPAAPHPPASPASEPAEPTADPEDWSEELAELDVQLQRLGWDRNQEATYLQRAFGHPSRNRITRYSDLNSYLRSLRALAIGSEPASASIPLKRAELLSQCDQLLQQLRWTAAQGRELLEREFQLSSRQQLSDEQLLQFNMLLEEQLLNAGSGLAAAVTPG